MVNFSGIYQIRNIINNKVYIGSTSKFKSRKASHFGHLRFGDHSNKYLQNAWNKYGEEKFVFEILEETENHTSALENREQYWYDLKKSYLRENGYNHFTKIKLPKSDYKTTDEVSNVLSEKGKLAWKNGKGEKILKTKRFTGSNTGANNPASKLKNEDVMLIKLMLSYNVMMSEIKKLFNVSKGVIRDIKINKTWKHIHINNA